MISTILFAVAGLSVVGLIPLLSARRRKLVEEPVRTRYSHNVVGDKPLPTWKPTPTTPAQPVGQNPSKYSSLTEGW